MATCEICGKILPEGWHSDFCDECMDEEDEKS